MNLIINIYQVMRSLTYFCLILTYFTKEFLHWKDVGSKYK